MKIRSDFVTNSSSTVFVLVARSQLTREGIRQLVGIRPGSPLEPVGDRLFELLQSSGRSVRTAEDAAAELAEEDLAHVVEQYVRPALDAGHEIRIGKFHSDGDEIESLIRCDSFEAENDEYYLNALRCYW